MATEKDENITSITELKAMKTAEDNRDLCGNTIRAARIAKGLSQPKLGEILGVPRNYVSNWEVGRAQPGLKMVPEICKALDIGYVQFFTGRPDANTLSDDEREVIKTYRQLGEHDQKLVREMVDCMMRNIEDERVADSIRFMNSCRENFLRRPREEVYASAGPGEILDDCNPPSEMMFLRTNRLTARADIVIPVSGDSMEPTFSSGDNLLVRWTSELLEGQIGIIIINGEGFVKEYHHNGVRSHNEKKYPFRKFESDDSVRIIGRVLGRVTPDMLPTEEEQNILDEIADEIKD